MANKVTIEVEARFVDHLSDESAAASTSINDIGKAADKAKKKVDSLGKKKVKPIFDADSNKLLKKIRDAESRAEKLGKTKTTVVLKAMDKATSVIGKVLNKAQSFGGSVWNAVMRVKNSQAMEAIGSVISAGKSIAGKTWSAIVKIKDYATAPLKKIKDSLFSIKSLIAAVTAGFAAKQFILNPINLADAYSSAQIGFTTLLGEKGGQDMMDQIDEFAKKTPFKTSGVISNVQKMMAYGWDADSIIKDMETIGDAAAATGKGDEGLESIVYALSEIRSKGKLSTQELNQLASAGIKAKAYLAEGLGYGSDDEGMAKLAKALESGAIGANQAIDLILQGMEEFDGMMDKTANETVEGLISQIQDAFEINVFRKWGQGLQDGAKKGFGTIVSLLNDSEDALASLGDTLYEVGKSLSNWAADKLERAVKTIKEVTATDAFKNASLGGKIKILWNEVIAEPFSEWWNSEGKAKVAGFAEKIGKALGTGISGGLLALLGVDAEGALADGASIGGSFMEGFLEGFDTDKITDALVNWANNNKVLATVLGGILAGKLISGIGNVISGFKGIKGLLPGGSDGGTGGTLLSDAYAGTMNVTAGVVNVYGGVKNNASDVVDNVTDAYQTYKLMKNGNTAKQLLTGSGTGTTLLTGGSSTVKGLLGSGASGTAGKTLTGVVLKDGTVAATGSGLTAGLAKIGVGLGSGATTAGGAAAAGAAGTGGIVGMVIGAISAYADIFQGIKKGKSGDKKGAKDEYFSAGTKAGMMLYGAGVGAAIGSIIPGAGTAVGALVGGGIGGIVGTLTGDKAGKALSDGSDEGGWLSNAGKAIGNFFTKTLPEGWSSMWDSVGNFFTETIPTALAPIGEKIGAFFTETIPEKWNELWDAVGNFFTETVPYALGFATAKVATFFTETIPNAWNSFWDVVGNFFTETVPYAIGIAVGKIGVFFTETIPNAWNSFWDAIGAFFTETIPAWADTVWNGYVVPFFTETIPTAWNTFWGAIGTFFTETIPAWADTIWNEHIVPFFTETIPQVWDTFWGAIGGFFTETLPTWASNVWNNNIVPFFTETIPSFFGTLWDSVCGFFDETVDFIAESIWAPIKGFFTETIPGWASSAIEKVKNWWGGFKENFLAGYEAGSGGGSGGKKARGGIIGGTSSMDAFARGGRTDGGIVGGSTRWIRVNEESPEMIIPLSSQRRDRGLKLLAKTAEIFGLPGFARGGFTTGGNADEGIRFRGYGSTETPGERSVIVEVGGITIELKIEAADSEGVVQAIKEQIKDIAESVAGIFADEFDAIFENTPVRGVVN